MSWLVPQPAPIGLNAIDGLPHLLIEQDPAPINVAALVVVHRFDNGNPDVEQRAFSTTQYASPEQYLRLVSWMRDVHACRIAL